MRPSDLMLSAEFLPGMIAVASTAVNVAEVSVTNTSHVWFVAPEIHLSDVPWQMESSLTIDHWLQYPPQTSWNRGTLLLLGQDEFLFTEDGSSRCSATWHFP